MEDPCGLPWVVWPSGFTEAVIVLYLDRFCSRCLCKWRFLFHLCFQNIWQKLQGNGGRALYLLVGKKEPMQNCWDKQLIPLLKRGSSCRLERRQHCLGPFSRSLWLIAALLSGMDFFWGGVEEVQNGILFKNDSSTQDNPALERGKWNYLFFCLFLFLRVED